MSKDTPLAHTGTIVAAAPKKARPKEVPLRWEGTETLAGYGKLEFAMYPSGRAVMVDAKNTMEGIWRQQDGQYTLSFGNGSIVYTGTLADGVISGTATSPSPRQQKMRQWNWTVEQQPGG